jgi:hypothetical protein
VTRECHARFCERPVAKVPGRLSREARVALLPPVGMGGVVVANNLSGLFVVHIRAISCERPGGLRAIILSPKRRRRIKLV